jgi:hypothetical protein
MERIMNVHSLTTLEKLLKQQEDMDYMLKYLLDYFDSPQKINIWLNTANVMFGGATPALLIQLGKVNKIVAYMKSVEEGW